MGADIKRCFVIQVDWQRFRTRHAGGP
jgi:hypothetical protein